MKIQKQFDALTASQKKSVIELCEEVSRPEAIQAFNETLDSRELGLNIGALEYSASEAFKAVDPVAYNFAFVEFFTCDDCFVRHEGSLYRSWIIEEEIKELKKKAKKKKKKKKSRAKA